MSVGIDLSSSVIALSFDSITITRTPSTYNSQGVAVRGSPTTVVVRASVQPTSGRDLDRLTEGQRQRGAVTIYSLDPLRLSASGHLSDTFVWRGDAYSLVTATQWDSAGFWRTIATKTEV